MRKWLRVALVCLVVALVLAPSAAYATQTLFSVVVPRTGTPVYSAKLVVPAGRTLAVMHQASTNNTPVYFQACDALTKAPIGAEYRVYPVSGALPTVLWRNVSLASRSVVVKMRIAPTMYDVQSRGYWTY